VLLYVIILLHLFVLKVLRFCEHFSKNKSWYLKAEQNLTHIINIIGIGKSTHLHVLQYLQLTFRLFFTLFRTWTWIDFGCHFKFSLYKIVHNAVQSRISVLVCKIFGIHWNFQSGQILMLNESHYWNIVHLKLYRDKPPFNIP